MNKHLLSIIFGILLLFAVGNSAKATKQSPDYIIINGEKFELYVDWSFPSVLHFTIVLPINIRHFPCGAPPIIAATSLHG